MRKLLCSVVMVTAFFQLTVAHAVMRLSDDGVGQVVLFPYYTVNDGNDTLFQINNTTDRYKALRVSFHEARNGVESLAFNIYLAPSDTWFAAAAADSPDGPAIVFNADQSCTVPQFDSLLYGIPVQALSSVNYQGDGGGDSDARTREGYFQVIEMGEVLDGDDGLFTDLISPDQPGDSPDCEGLNAQWAPGGLWNQEPQRQMGPPTGGITGSASIINVQRGYETKAIPQIIKQFYVPTTDSPPSLHRAADSSITLNDGGSGVTDAPVAIEAQNAAGQIVAATFARPIDGVSALLMASSLRNEFSIEPGINAAAQWVATFPTRRFYVDETAATAPFTAAWTGESQAGSGDATSPEALAIDFWNRDGQPGAIAGQDCADIIPCLPQVSPSLDFAANVVTFENRDDPDLAFFGSQTNLSVPLPIDSFDNGIAELTFADRTLVSLEGTTFSGLPIIGFAAQVVRNETLERFGDTVLANYGTATPFRVTDHIEESSLPDAMSLATNGLGEVLLLPHYSTNDNNNTLITLHNTTDQAKAVRARWLESRNGRELLALNLYLGPQDTWTTAIAPGATDEDVASLISFDRSCTVPRLVETNGQPQLPLSIDGYTGDNADGLGDGPSRTRQGYIEFIELGVVASDLDDGVVGDELGDFLAAVDQSPNCDGIDAAWEVSGAWSANRQQDMLPPSGGLMASANIIDVGRGIQFTTEATAIKGFYLPGPGALPSLHRAPTEGVTLNSGGTGVSGQPASVLVAGQSGRVLATFARSVDAVSALLMADRVSGRFAMDSAIQADTDWVVTLPTRPFYVTADEAIAPFTEPLKTESESQEAGTFEAVSVFAVDRDGTLLISDSIQCFFICLPTDTPPSSKQLTEVSNVLMFSVDDPQVTRSNLLRSRNVELVTIASGFAFAENGFAEVSLDERQLTSLEGITFSGLPAIGFTATSVRNGTLAGGNLANYASANELTRRSVVTTPTP